MPFPEQLALALAAGVASGLNAYASLGMLGLLQRYEVIHLPPPLDGLSSTWAIAIALVLFAIEFFADKIPYIDNVWDAVHTFIRIPIGAWLASGVFANHPGGLQVLMALAGGTLALHSHGAKASTRLAVNASPEPFSNWALSFGEDAFVVFLLWMAARHPYITLVIVAALMVIFIRLIRTIFRGMKRLFQRRREATNQAAPQQSEPRA